MPGTIERGDQTKGKRTETRRQDGNVEEDDRAETRYKSQFCRLRELVMVGADAREA